MSFIVFFIIDIFLLPYILIIIGKLNIFLGELLMKKFKKLKFWQKLTLRVIALSFISSISFIPFIISLLIIYFSIRQIIKSLKNKSNDHPLGIAADENAIITYTDYCLDNIKSDIEYLDITVVRPSSVANALLSMSKMLTDNGRYFDTYYIRNSLK
mgnify:FL=1